MNFSEFAQQNGIEVISFNPHQPFQEEISSKPTNVFNVILLLIVCTLILIYIKIRLDEGSAEIEKKYCEK